MASRWFGIFLTRYFGIRERRIFITQSGQARGMVERALRRVRQVNKGAQPPICAHLFLGEPHIDPKTLRVVLLFRDDHALDQAQRNGLTQMLHDHVCKALASEGYPADALPHIDVLFAGKRTVDSVGGARVYFR
jgi:hypothetical protein